MKPVDQRVIYDPNDPVLKGDCVAACIASILEIPLKEDPNYSGGGYVQFGDVP